MSTNLKKLRDEYNYTQEYVAKQIGVSTRRYRDYEGGEPFTTDILLRLKNLYGTSVDYILGIEDVQPVMNDNFIRNETGLSLKSINKLKELNKDFQTHLFGMQFGIKATGHVYANSLDKMKLVVIDKLLSSELCDSILDSFIKFSFPHDNAVPCIKNEKGKMELLDKDIYLAYDKNRLDDNTKLSLNQITDKASSKIELDILLQEFSNDYNKLMKRILSTNK